MSSSPLDWFSDYRGSSDAEALAQRAIAGLLLSRVSDDAGGEGCGRPGCTGCAFRRALAAAEAKVKARPSPAPAKPVRKELFAESLFVDVQYLHSLNLRCPICHDICCDVVTIKDKGGDCDHAYCRDCVTQHFKTSQQCALCKTPFTADQIMTAKAFARLIDDAKVTCLHSDKKCEWTGRRGDLQTHLDNKCERESVSCAACKTTVLRKDKSRHDQDECAGRIVQCKFCQVVVRFDRLERHHDDECEQNPKTVTLGDLHRAVRRAREEMMRSMLSSQRETKTFEPKKATAVDESGLDAEDIRIIVEQTKCSRSLAAEALRHTGNLVDAILVCLHV